MPLNELLKKCYIFENLPENILNAISEKFTPVKHQLGDLIISLDEPAEFIFLIKSGRARLVDDRDKPINLKILKKGECFGEDSLFNNKLYTTTVRASDDLELFKLPLIELESVLKIYPEISEKIEKKSENFNRYKFLKCFPLFSEYKPDEAEKIFSGIEYEKIRSGDTIYSESDESDNAVIIYQGNIKLLKTSKENRLLHLAKSGEIISEASLLGIKVRAETALAEKDSEIFILTKEVFDRVAAQRPKAVEFIQTLVDNRSLQYDTILSLDEKVESATPHEIILKKIKYGKGFKAKQLFFAETDNPNLSGIACLAMINSSFKKTGPIKSLIEKQILINQPDTLISASRKFENNGYITRLITSCPVKIREADFPVLLEWDNHEVCTLYSVTKEFALIASPIKGILKIPLKEFFEKWDRQVLNIDYVPEFGGVGKEIKKVFKRFLPLLKPYKRILISIGVISIFIQMVSVVLPIFSGIIIDKVFIFGDTNLLYLMLIGILFVTAFQLIGNILRQYLVAHAMRRLSASLLFRFLKHILLLPQKVFLKWQVGDFTTRFMENEKLLQLLSQNAFKVIIDSGTIIFYLFILLSTNATLTGYSMIFILLYAVLILYSSPKLRANEIEVFNRLRDSESFLIETVGNIGTIKSMAAEKIFYESGVQKFVDQKKTAFKTAKFSYIIGLVSGILNEGSVVLVLGMGSKMALEGKITTGELIAFNATLGLVMAPLNSLINMWDEIQQMRVSFERINDVLSLETEAVDQMIITEPLKGHIKFEGVTFKYEGTEKNALEEINLDILPGQKVALVGRSGSGKTTFVNMLNKLLEPSTGKIYYDARDISEVDPPSLRSQLGFVEQQPYLFNGSIKENILVAANKDMPFEKMVEIAKLAGVDEYVSKLPMGYDTQIGERGMTLSGGEKQRIVIARALINDPRVLILDEATSALDTESERIIQGNLDSVMKGRTSIIIAHRLSTIKNSDKIIVMDQGKIVEVGTHDELIQLGGLYYYLNQKSRIE